MSVYIFSHKFLHSGEFCKTIRKTLSIFGLTLLLIQAHLKAQPLPDIIFTQVSADGIQGTAIEKNKFSPAEKYINKCRIVILPSSTEEPLNLTPEFYSAADPDLSFDGNFIIFSGKKEAGDNWQIWKMKRDGSDKMQITKEAGDCIMPVYAGSRFYLDDPQPTPQIIYTGTAHNWINSLESRQVYSLYATDYQGSKIRRLTFNLYSDFSPDVLPNGRIVFSSMQFSGGKNLSQGKLAFFGINNDGTDLMPFYGNHESPDYKNDIHISDTDDRIYFIESEGTDSFGGGNIALLSKRRPFHSYQQVAKADKGYYHSPCPLPGAGLLVSYRTNNPDDVYALYILNPKTAERKKVFKTSGWHSIDAQICAPRPVVKGRSNWLVPNAVTGVFYCLDSYQTSLTRPAKIDRGDFKYVRILEGLPAKKDTVYNVSLQTGNPGFESFNPVRILGVAPVEKDGSFQVRVPAEIPLTFQMLDENKMTIARQQTWIWVMGNENRGCIGCHEDREMSPVNRLVNAVTKPPVEIATSVENRRTVDFKNHIEPLIFANCTSSQCHLTGKSRLNFGNTKTKPDGMDVYKMLLGPVKDSNEEYYIFPGYARRSPLVWHLYGKRLSNGETIYNSAVSQMPPGHQLSEDEKLLITEWIDLGAQWDMESAAYRNPPNDQ